MRETIFRVRGLRLAGAAAILVATCSWISIPYVKRHLLPTFPNFTPLPSSTASADGLGTTLHRIFSAPPAVVPVDPRAAALKQLDVAGLPANGDALIRAAATGHRPLVELLLTAGVDVNSIGAGARTAFLTAILKKDWSMADYLLGVGAEINQADESGLTPLMAVSSTDRKELLATLIARGAELDAADTHGHTALHYAVAARNSPGLTLLLAAGADSTKTCCENANLMTHAFATRDWSLVQPVLALQSPALSWNSDSRALLQQVVHSRDHVRTKLLLSKHPAAPTPEGLQQPLLAYTVLTGNLAQFKFLLECGAHPDTPLNTPAEQSFIDKVPGGYLRHYLGSEPGMTVMMLAAGMGQRDYVEELLNRGAARGMGTKNHKMPASVFAARAGEHTSTLQLLLGKESPKPEELRIEISLGSQRASLIKNGATVMSTQISSGRSGFSTPTGQYVVTDKHRSHMSTIYKVKMPYFMRLSYRDFGLHQGVVPDYPASHGCIRVPSSNIARLFQQVPVGTLVSIY